MTIIGDPIRKDIDEMTYAVSREGRNLGTYSEEGISRQLDNGVLLPTDLIFLEREQKWAPISELPPTPTDELAQFEGELEVATPTAFVTSTLIAINIAVFFVMALAGASPIEPTNGDLVRWGADFGPLTTNGQWWRLLTSAFEHVGLLHIAFNMWVLFSGGRFAERLFGHAEFLTLYLLSAIGGSLASVHWQPLTVAAGASGAIFGVYGAILGLVLVRRNSIPAVAAASLFRSAGLFVGYNLLFGLTDSHIDMAAHLGGLFTGLLAGCALAYRADPAQERSGPGRIAAVALAGLLSFIPVAAKMSAGNPRQAEAYATEFTGKRLHVAGNNVTVYANDASHEDIIAYSGHVTEADAKRLGLVLTTTGYFRDRGALALYSKDQGGSVVSLLVKDGAWLDPKLTFGFNILGTLISRATTTPLKLRLLDQQRDVKKEFVFNH